MGNAKKRECKKKEKREQTKTLSWGMLFVRHRRRRREGRGWPSEATEKEDWSGVEREKRRERRGKEQGKKVRLFFCDYNLRQTRHRQDSPIHSAVVCSRSFLLLCRPTHPPTDPALPHSPPTTPPFLSQLLEQARETSVSAIALVLRSQLTCANEG